MDFFSIIFSVNKVALVFFILTLGFIVYELGMYLRERQPTKTPYIPQFDPNSHASSMTAPSVMPVQRINTDLPIKKKRPMLLLIATLVLIILGGFTLFYTPTTKIVSKPPPNKSVIIPPTPTILKTVVPTSIPTSIPTPTSAAKVKLVTEEVSIAPTDTPIPTKHPTSTPTETLPAAGSHQFLLLLTVVASAVVVVSLLF